MGLFSPPPHLPPPVTTVYCSVDTKFGAALVTLMLQTSPRRAET